MLNLWEKLERDYEGCLGFIVYIGSISLITIVGSFVWDYYKTTSEYNEYYECIDSYYTNKEGVKQEIDDVINNVKLQLSPYIAAGLESDFYDQMEYIEIIARTHPKSRLGIDLGDNFYDFFWGINVGYFGVTVGLEYQIENNKKLESAYQYLINRLDEIHEEYPCRQPEESRTDSYIAYKKFCAREIEIHDELNENSICNNNITNRRKYKAYMKEKKIQEEEYSKKREKTRQIEQLNNPKCIEKYGEGSSYYLDSSSGEEYCKVFEGGSRGPEKKPFK